MALSPGRARVAIINDDTAFLDLMRELVEVDENYEVLICKEWDKRLAVRERQAAGSDNSGHPHRRRGEGLDDSQSADVGPKHATYSDHRLLRCNPVAA
jgi:hypothetical protein